MDKRKTNEWKRKNGRNSSYIMQNRTLNNIFGSRRDKVTGDWRRWHSEDIRDLYCLLNVIVVIISRRTMCVGRWSGWGGGHIVVCGGENGGNEQLGTLR
jgi:hypothetical protein